MIDCKIRVNGERESEAIQRFLFKKGVRWGENRDVVSHVDIAKFLFVKDSCLTYSTTDYTFDECTSPEVKFKFEVTNYDVIDNTVELTVEEVSERLGYPVKIVKCPS